jgi:hypothetical protein
MSEDKNKIPQNQPKPKDRNYSEKVNESFGENKTQQDDLRKGAEIPPKKKDK